MSMRSSRSSTTAAAPARSLLLLLLLLSLGAGLLPIALAKVACNDTAACEAAYRPGSECGPAGFCTNPFAGGCLRRLRGPDLHPRPRACNSDDGPGASSDCAPSPLDYEEVRIVPNQWESAMFYAWLLQILLSEVLDVPTTVETGPGGGALNFYDEGNGFAYPKKSNNFDALYEANRVGDCRDTDAPCGHFITEVWQGKRVLNDSAVEREGNGMVGGVGWLIPQAAAKRDPSLTHYLGLAGPDNRQKLADTFRRPMVWGDYCRAISPNNCTTPNNVTARAPADDAEAGKYFVPGEYTGHFVATERNDCAANPNCTGHIIDYPCTWSAYTASQLHWNDIALESDTPDGTNAYAYGDMLGILAASNATNNPIMIVWWYPDPTMDLYSFVRVALPAASRACLNSRPEAKPNRCNATREALLGEEVGSCGYNTHTLEKYFAVSFRERSTDTPLALRSPGHQLVRNAHFSDVDIQEMMVAWASRGADKYGYDPREAVCAWAADNFDKGFNLQKFVPLGYPREIEDEVGYDTAPMRVATAYGVVGAVVAVLVGLAVYRYRKEKQIKYAQDIFLYLFSLGLFFVCLGGVMYSLVPSAGSCAARWWFVMIGFTFSLVPLLIKIAAINKCMNDAKKMRRTKVSKEKVYKHVAVLVLVVVVYLSLWTGIDAPVSESDLFLVSADENLVEVHITCASESIAWELLAFGWEGLLICFTATVAFLSRNITQAFNESRVVGAAAYSMFFFLVFRLLVVFLPLAVLQPASKNVITSFLLTSESLVTLGIYLGPKFYSIYKNEKDATDRSTMQPSSARSSRAGFSSTSSSVFSSRKNSDVCPMCEQKLPIGDPEPAKATPVVNRRTYSAVNSGMESIAETPVSVEKLSNHDITSESGSVLDRRVRFLDADSPVSGGKTIEDEEDAGATTEQFAVPTGSADKTDEPRSSESGGDTAAAPAKERNGTALADISSEENSRVSGGTMTKEGEQTATTIEQVSVPDGSAGATEEFHSSGSVGDTVPVSFKDRIDEEPT